MVSIVPLAPWKSLGWAAMRMMQASSISTGGRPNIWKVITSTRTAQRRREERVGRLSLTHTDLSCPWVWWRPNIFSILPDALHKRVEEVVAFTRGLSDAEEEELANELDLELIDERIDEPTPDTPEGMYGMENWPGHCIPENWQPFGLFGIPEKPIPRQEFHVKLFVRDTDLRCCMVLGFLDVMRISYETVQVHPHTMKEELSWVVVQDRDVPLACVFEPERPPEYVRDANAICFYLHQRLHERHLIELVEWPDASTWGVLTERVLGRWVNELIVPFLRMVLVREIEDAWHFSKGVTKYFPANTIRGFSARVFTVVRLVWEAWRIRYSFTSTMREPVEQGRLRIVEQLHHTPFEYLTEALGETWRDAVYPFRYQGGDHHISIFDMYMYGLLRGIRELRLFEEFVMRTDFDVWFAHLDELGMADQRPPRRQ